MDDAQNTRAEVFHMGSRASERVLPVLRRLRKLVRNRCFTIVQVRHEVQESIHTSGGPMNLSRHSHAASFLTTIAFTGALAASAAAFAQVDNPPHSTPPHNNSPTATPPPQHNETAAQTSMTSTMGKHDMPGTVTSVDHKTGMVQVESEKMKLKVHFPAETIADLKKGDKITLHLSYTKG